jgi:hypothetical protein
MKYRRSGPTGWPAALDTGGLQVRFPAQIVTHNPDQVFYFDASGAQRRMDYVTEVNGSALIGHYTSRYKTFDGLLVATRRRVFRRNPDNTVNLNLPSITLDIHDVELVRSGGEQGTTMTTNTTAIDHADRRLVVALPCSYDEARAHYETLVPQADSARFSQMCSWQATLELAEINAPHGFMIYYRGDVTAVTAGSPSFWKATHYLMGNHMIAGRMFRHDPSVMLHAPLRTLLYADPTVTPSSPSTSPACCSPATATPGSPTSATNSTLSSPGSSSCSATTCRRN